MGSYVYVSNLRTFFYGIQSMIGYAAQRKVEKTAWVYIANNQRKKYLNCF